MLPLDSEIHQFIKESRGTPKRSSGPQTSIIVQRFVFHSRSRKDSLMSDRLKMHYDPDREIVVSCDASPYGLGAVLSHRMREGPDRPVCYASRSLSSAEKGYSQLDKEGLAIVFAIRKFHQFLYGRSFVITQIIGRYSISSVTASQFHSLDY